MQSVYLCAPVLVCFDGDTSTSSATSPASSPASSQADPSKGEKPSIDFSPEQQEKLNSILAEEKRKHQEQYKKLEKQLNETLQTAQLSHEERAKLEESLEDVRKQLRSKEEQAKHEKKQLEEAYTKRIRELEARNSELEAKYTDFRIRRELQDAANTNDAFNPEIIVTVLRPWVKIVDEKVMIDFRDVSTDTGEPIITQMTPYEAVARMKQLPDQYGGLFKSNVVSGVGAGSGTGPYSPGSGRVDPRKLTTEQYMKLRKENPEALGFAKNR